MAIQLFQPYVCQAAKDNVSRVLDTSWFGMGSEVEDFEKEFAEYIGCKYAIAMNSATAALQIALHSRPKRRKAIVATTPNTFVATNHVILQEGLIPHFIDIDPNTGAMSIEALEDFLVQHPRSVEAIMVVHYAGNPVDLRNFEALAQKYKAYLIEDAAHAAGASYGEDKIGAKSVACCFSFHAVKNLATGDGGMLVTSDPEVDKAARRLRWFGIDKSTSERTTSAGYSWEYNVESLGWKYHMNDITAALGRGQLRSLNWYNDVRRTRWNLYQGYLEDTGIHLLADVPGTESSRHLMVVRFPNKPAKERAIANLQAGEIQFGYHYKPNYLYPPYTKFAKPEDYPGMQAFYDTALTLPMHPFLRVCDIEKICKTITKGVIS